MKCDICNRERNNLFEVIYDKHLVSACENCVNAENLTSIKKPTQEQLERANQRATVHERMMRLSGLDKLSPVSKDHEIAQRHLAKIRIPQKKQFSDLLIPNYDWTITMSRRRRKMTLNQLSELTKVSVSDLDSLERGILPNNFEKIVQIIENVLNIILLKSSEKKMYFKKPEIKKSEIQVLEEARTRLFGKDIELNQRNEEIKKQQLEEAEEEKRKLEEAEEEKAIEEENELKEDLKEELSKGRFDFSSKEKLKNVTLNDLIDMKREKEKMAKREQEFEEKRKK